MEKNVFRLIVGHKTTEEAMAAGHYDYVNPGITSRNFPLRIRPRVGGAREIVLLEFNYDPDSEQVLAEAKRLGLERPDYDDSFDFGEQFPDVQRKFPVVFLHEPWQGLHHDLHVVVLDSDSSERYLDLGSFRLGWYRHCRFAFVRK